MKAEKYNIVIEVAGQAITKVRFGFGAAGEEVQRLLNMPELQRIRVSIEGMTGEATFVPGKPIRLLDIKQKIKGLSLDI